MPYRRPLPNYLVQRYRGWKATTFAENQSWFHHLAQDGQHPRAMVIACCDSRVNVEAIFGADNGEFFIHRNIANLVPPYLPDGNQHGTSAAIEYAVNSLHVAHIIVMGHSQCGGVAGCEAMCSGNAPELEEKTSFVGRWIDVLRPGYERVQDIEDPEDRRLALEKEAILVSLENLRGFPFVKAAIDRGDLTLHGLYSDIGAGGLEHYLHDQGFVQV